MRNLWIIVYRNIYKLAKNCNGTEALYIVFFDNRIKEYSTEGLSYRNVGINTDMNFFRTKLDRKMQNGYYTLTRSASEHFLLEIKASIVN